MTDTLLAQIEVQETWKSGTCEFTDVGAHERWYDDCPHSWYGDLWDWYSTFVSDHYLSYVITLGVAWFVFSGVVVGLYFSGRSSTIVDAFDGFTGFLVGGTTLAAIVCAIWPAVPPFLVLAAVWGVVVLLTKYSVFGAIRAARVRRGLAEKRAEAQRAALNEQAEAWDEVVRSLTSPDDAGYKKAAKAAAYAIREQIKVVK